MNKGCCHHCELQVVFKELSISGPTTEQALAWLFVAEIGGKKPRAPTKSQRFLQFLPGFQALRALDVAGTGQVRRVGSQGR